MILRWLCNRFGARHQWYHKPGESYIKCDCGATIDFIEIVEPNELLPEWAIGPDVS